MTLREAAVGQTVRVQGLTGSGPVRRRIMDMGITRGIDLYVEGGCGTDPGGIEIFLTGS